jgi:hypothetical protein
MDARIQEMLDHYEITKTLKEYCFGCDRCDPEIMRSVYLEDSFDDHGHVKAPGPEFVRIMIGDIRGTTDSLSHLLGQSLVRVDGDKAGADTYFLAVFHNTSEDGTRMCNQLGGRFVDRFEREDGRWRIKHRQVVRDWSISLPVEADALARAGLMHGQRSDSDPAFAVLGLRHSGA